MRSSKKSRRRDPRARRKVTSRADRRLALIDEQLQLTQAQLALAADAGVGTWSFNAATERLSCSARFKEIFAIAPHETLTPELVIEMIHPDDRPCVDRRLREAVSAKTNCEAEFRIRRRDGSVRHLRVLGRGRDDGTGDLLRVEGVVRDVTERTLAIERIQRSLDRIKALRDIETAITSTLELDRMLELLLDKIDALTRYAAATVRLVNRDNGRLEPVAAKNINVDEWKRASRRVPAACRNSCFKTPCPWLFLIFSKTRARAIRIS